MTIAADWSGRVGQVWAEQWSRTERSFAALEPSLEAAILAVAPACGRFLDIGCGVGTTTLAVAAARPAAQVAGVDLSGGMIAVATDRAAATPNAAFHHADALDHATAHGPLDLFFSRHGVMFFADPDAAFRRLHAAAAIGAPLVFSCFAAIADNPWATLLAPAPARSSSYAPGPFAFADSGAAAAFLHATGWRGATARRIEYRYVAGQGDDPVADALALFTHIGPAASALRDARPGDRPALLDRLRMRIDAARTGEIVDFPAAAWIWRAYA